MAYLYTVFIYDKLLLSWNVCLFYASPIERIMNAPPLNQKNTMFVTSSYVECDRAVL